MSVAVFLLSQAVVLAGQVPPPTSSEKSAAPLRLERQTVLDRETRRLVDLADRLERENQKEAARVVRSALAPPLSGDGPERFATVPEVVPARLVEKDETAWARELGTVRFETAAALFDLAGRAAGAEPRHYALADRCLREVVARNHDHAEARRLLGQVPHNGGWATPYAVGQFREGKVPHPVFGWVKASWVPHLARGELPAPIRPGETREFWLPAAEADALRRDFEHGWRIFTEHFAIQTNVSLADAIAFGRHLETLHEVFEGLFADVLADRSPLAQRFRNRTMTGESSSEAHQVAYFATREQYGAAVSIFTDVDPARSLGYYHPPQGRGARRGRAYFFRDEGGALEATATLFHEASHQLLFESGAATAAAFRENAGNYWVVEGLGTYFETLTVGPDGAVRIGGLVGARNAEARRRLVLPGQLTPLAAFVGYQQGTFNRDDLVVRHYLEASALTSYLMHGDRERFRDGFLDYVRDACQGRLRRTSGRSLEARLEVPYDTIESGFLDYLKK